MVELGRSCVHADWRCGGVIMALWGALGEFMTRNGLDTMVGCASVSMQDGGHVAKRLHSSKATCAAVLRRWARQPGTLISTAQTCLC